MPKLQIMSDLHLGFHKDQGVGFINSLDPKGIDALIIAGDMGEQKDIDLPLEMLCEKYKRVIRVQGNHEYWHSSKQEVQENERMRMESYSNYSSLNNDIVEVEGQRILGTTLWYSYVPEEISRDWSDFATIQGFASWVWDENKKAQKFLEKNIQEGDIVVTHYLPSEKCIAPKFKGDPMNAFFLCDMEDVIKEKKPAIWFFGHTHTAYDKKLSKTRLICNPYGYHGYESKTGYKNMVVET